MADPFPTSGSVKDTSLPDLLKTVCRAEISGELKFTRDDLAKSVFFQDGRIINAASNEPDDRLGEYLLKIGMITASQYLESVKYIRPGRKQGTILCELGAINPEELLSGIRGQVMRIICSVFHWEGGTFAFETKGLLVDSLLNINIHVEQLILEGIRQIRFWSKIFKGLGSSLNMILTKTSESENILYKLELTGDEEHIFSLINGKFTIEQICGLSYLSNFDTMRQLWSFVCIDAAKPVSLEAATSQQYAILPEEDYYLQDLVEDYNTVFSYVYDYVFERIGELVEHICDGAVDEARREFASLLTDINLKNHGHVDYEQFLANVGAATPSDRQALIEKCLTGIGQAMISMVQKELGQEEKNQLVGELKMFSSSASLNICRQH